ncbi:MAG TPA: hypothetical protein VFJ16_10380 [Longimicrobium sp.]|nr:hypothetical protein [Longimicrobium sp.]
MRTLPNDPRAALALMLALAAAPLAAQAAAPAAAPPAGRVAAAAPAPGAATLPAGDVYRREVFRYLRGGRPDPFTPLLTAAELGFRVEDLRLTSIIYSPDARRSIAVFAEGDSARRYRLHQGQRLGTMTVLRIWPQRVDVRVDEFGGSRLQTVLLQRAQRQEPAAPAAAQAGQPQLPVTITQQAPQQEAARVLRRGTTAVQNGVSAGTPARPAPPAPAAAPSRPVNPSSPNYTTQVRP